MKCRSVKKTALSWGFFENASGFFGLYSREPCSRPTGKREFKDFWSATGAVQRVIPAKAEIQNIENVMASRLRGSDGAIACWAWNTPHALRSR
ncbi:hypothetical protein EDC27_1628 [Desulfosoma caldarium]|uniref:Uncharacterized protein n=1 Tax=Desulfosoma caldarium TaxID=610254 RepID=A0A3N1UYG3_9BACT|nr:hypothetical protein EDC27_1628 [Desulfosoma caldarium]